MHRAWRVRRPGRIDGDPLRLERELRPSPGDGELLLRVRACGVCRTDLHVAEGDLPTRRDGVVPGRRCCAPASSATALCGGRISRAAGVAGCAASARARRRWRWRKGPPCIHLSDVPPLNYQQHLFGEKEVRSVTANTRDDARQFLAVAAEHRLSVRTATYPLVAADSALRDLAAGRVTGAAVLVPEDDRTEAS